MSCCQLMMVFAAFAAVLVFIIIASAFVPELLLSGDVKPTSTVQCANPACASVQLTASASGLSPMNQFLLMDMAIRKPAALIDGTPDPFRGFGVEFLQTMRIEVMGLTAETNAAPVLLANASHARDVVCRPNEDWCAPVVVLLETFLAYPSYRVHVTLNKPLSGFGNEGKIQPVVDFRLSKTTVNQDSTQAELGLRYFCFTTSLLCALLFVVVLVRRRGFSSWTLEQRWAVLLLWSAALFSNPLVLVAVYSPGPEWSVFNTFVTVTFVCMLQTFWLVYTHVVVLAAAHRAASSSTLELTAGFYLPKLLFMAFFYCAALGGALFVLYSAEADPAFSLWEDLPFAKFVLGVGTALGVLYLLWLAVYAAFAARSACRGALSRPFQLYLATSGTAVLALVGGVFGGAYFPNASSSTPTFALFAAGNLYVWTFAFVNAPGLEPRGGGRFTDAADAAHRATVEAAAAEDDTGGILGDTIDAAAAEDMELELSGEGAAAPRAAAAAAGDDAFAIDDDDDDKGEGGAPATSGRVTSDTDPAVVRSPVV